MEDRESLNQLDPRVYVEVGAYQLAAGEQDPGQYAEWGIIVKKYGSKVELRVDYRYTGVVF